MKRIKFLVACLLILSGCSTLDMITGDKYHRDMSDMAARVGMLTVGNENLYNSVLKLYYKLQQEIVNGQIRIKLLKDRIILSIDNKILFETNKVELKKESLKSLRKIAIAILDLNYSKIEVEGNTDNVPIAKNNEYWKDNWELSAQRALAVLRYMLKHASFDVKKICIVGRGEYNPADNNVTEKGRSNNRRVDIIIIPDVNSK